VSDFFKIKHGVNIKPETGSTVAAEGDLAANDTTNKLEYHNGSSASPVVTEAHTATLTNKTLVAASNTITTAASGNLSAVELNAALAELQTDIDTRATSTALTDHLNDAADAHDASAISSVAAGNLAATTVQTALDELQTDIDTRATSAALANHEADTTGIHGITDTAALVTLTGSQTLTNKTLTSPAITTPTGIVKGDVGLGNVDNTSDATKNAAAVTLTNKTITAPIIDAISLTDQASVAAPAAGTTKIYSKTDGKIYKQTSTAEVEIGAGSSGGINYISANGGNADAESGTSGWTLYADGAATPSDLDAGSATATWTQITSSQLRGTASFKFTAGALGNGVRYVITPDRADIKKGAVLYGSFDYEVSATTATGDYTVWVYDVANSLLIQPAGYQVVGGVSGSGYKHIFSFQLPTNGTTFRIGLHQAVASPGGNITCDNFVVGPQTIQYGAPVTDWAVDTGFSISHASGGITNHTATYYSRRVGGELEVMGDVVFSSASAAFSEFRIDVGGGRSIDTAKIPGYVSLANLVGNVSFYDSGATVFPPGPVVVRSSTQLDLRATTQVTHAGSAPAVTTTITNSNPITFAASDHISFKFKIPISGWSSTVQMSNDTDTRVVAARYEVSAATGNASFADAATEIVDYDLKSYDTHSAVTTGASWKFTAPVSGVYEVTACCNWFNSTNLNNGSLFLYKNGSSVSRLDRGEASEGILMNGTDTIYLVAGDYIDVRANQDDSASAARSIATGAGNSMISVRRLSGPAAIAASESISARYTDTSGQTYNTGAYTVYKFNTKDYDSHGCYSTSTGVYTVPVQGKYRVAATLSFTNAGAIAAGSGMSAAVYKNGSVVGTFFLFGGNGAAGATYVQSGSDVVNCVAGDTLEIRAFGAAASTTAVATADRNHVTFERIGN
jgi:hypothetical protein